MTYGCPTEAIPDVTTPLDEPLRVTHFLWELDIVIDQVISRPRASAEACCEEHGDSELRRAVREHRTLPND